MTEQPERKNVQHGQAHAPSATSKATTAGIVQSVLTATHGDTETRNLDSARKVQLATAC